MYHSFRNKSRTKVYRVFSESMWKEAQNTNKQLISGNMNQLIFQLYIFQIPVMPIHGCAQIFLQLILCASLAAWSGEARTVPKMAPAMPVFRFPLSKLKIPSLELLSEALAKGIRNRIYCFATEFSKVLMKHLSSETEVQIEKGCLTEDSLQVLQQLESEMAILQYRKNLQSILGPWQNKLVGQPVYPAVHNYLGDCIQGIYEDFENFIIDLQAHANKQMHENNKQLCSKVCKSSSNILNLTTAMVPPELDLLFKDGPNAVPLDALNIIELKNIIENDLISAAIKFIWDENKVYPKIDNPCIWSKKCFRTVDITSSIK